MGYEIKDLSLVEKKIMVNVSAVEVDIVIDAVVKSYQDKTEAKGFRKGKVPHDIVFNKNKDEILFKAAQQICNVRVPEAKKVYGVAPLNTISVEPENRLEKGKPFSFSFTVEVIPDLELPEYKGLALEQPEAKVTESDIDNLMKGFVNDFSTFESIEGQRFPKDGDVVVVDFDAVGEFSQKPGASSENDTIELGAGLLIKDFETIVKGLKKGETGTGEVLFPEDYPNRELAGQKVDMRVTLKDLKKKIEPLLDETLLQKAAGVSSVEQLRDKMKKNRHAWLVSNFERQAKFKLLDELTKDMQIPLSPALVSRNLTAMMDEHRYQLQQQGKNPEQILKRLGELEVKLMPEAEKASQKQLFLLAIARQEKLKLEEDELMQDIRLRARQAKKETQQFLIEIQSSGLMGEIKQQLMLKKVFNFIYDKADKKIISA